MSCESRPGRVCDLRFRSSPDRESPWSWTGIAWKAETTSGDRREPGQQSEHRVVATESGQRAFCVRGGVAVVRVGARRGLLRVSYDDSEWEAQVGFVDGTAHPRARFHDDPTSPSSSKYG